MYCIYVVQIICTMHHMHHTHTILLHKHTQGPTFLSIICRTYGQGSETGSSTSVEWNLSAYVICWQQHMSYVGSSYELSSLSGSSDYDIQVFLKMPPGPGKRNVPKPTTGRIHKCDRKGWRKIYGGPAHLLTDNGYLSACKVSVSL
mgnify:CR=1 FL=1